MDVAAENLASQKYEVRNGKQGFKRCVGKMSGYSAMTLIQNTAEMLSRRDSTNRSGLHPSQLPSADTKSPQRERMMTSLAELTTLSIQGSIPEYSSVALAHVQYLSSVSLPSRVLKFV
ncbi:hypothetical protein TNCV_405051 [Trichonephila clavipes]|nr:hypothetical protein TNCV_405051 [Trichonephila clavipes]